MTTINNSLHHSSSAQTVHVSSLNTIGAVSATKIDDNMVFPNNTLTGHSVCHHGRRALLGSLRALIAKHGLSIWTAWTVVFGEYITTVLFKGHPRNGIQLALRSNGFAHQWYVRNFGRKDIVLLTAFTCLHVKINTWALGLGIKGKGTYVP